MKLDKIKFLSCNVRARDMDKTTEIKFDGSRKDDLGRAREVLLCYLRDLNPDAINQFGQTDPVFDRYVEFGSPADKHRLDERLRQVLWEFIVNGVIVPGNGLHTHGVTLPFFSISNFGRDVLRATGPIPHDPDGYLNEVGGKTCLDDVGIGYVEEALCCFARGCYTASVLLLAVGAEAVALKVCELMAGAGSDPELRKSYEQVPNNVKAKHRWLVDLYENLPGKRAERISRMVST